jgi:tetratricopeptide (TPR) repeat protein
VGPVTKQSEHLSNAQIENYGIRTSGAGLEAAQRDEHQRVNHQSIDDQSINDQRINDQRVEAHLADCASCRNGLLEFHRNLFAPMADSPEADPSGHDTSPSGDSPSAQRWADSKVEGAKPTDSALADSKFANSKYPVQAQVRTAPTPECPSDDALRQLAAGLTPDDAAAKLTQHAATCDHCGPLLRTFTEDFSDDFTPEEQAALNQLSSASPKWQQQTARKMLQVGTKSADSSWKLPRWNAWKWVPAFSFVLLLAAGATWVYPLLILHKARLAVEAEYRKGRPMKYRATEVPYGSYDRERGSGNSSQSGSENDLRKIALLNRDKAPLLAANAAFLLPRDGYTQAKSILKQAVDRDRSLPLLNNLAVADAMEADAMQPTSTEERKQQQDIYKRAWEITEEILRKTNRSDPSALFNQALILERLDEKQKAIEALEEFERVEQDPGWRQEAAEELQLLRSLP